MLIIAIPKSCSTSLMETLGRLHDLPAEQINLLPIEKPPLYRLLSEIHYDQADLTTDLVEAFMSRGRLYKQHVLPTSNNLRLLHGLRKVVLLRQPKDVVASYRRAVMAGMVLDPNKGPGRVRQLMGGHRTEGDWLERSREIGLLDELTRFFDGWAKNDDDQLVVHYDDLLRSPGAIVNQIEDYFELQRSHDVSLSKKRYSRSPWQNLRRKARRTPLIRVKKLLTARSR